MTDINTAVVAGRLVKNAEFRQVGSSNNVKFTIAVNKSRKVNDQWEDETSYVDIVGWGRLADNMQGRLPQGVKVTVAGSLKQDRWEQNGEKRSKLYVLAEQIDVQAPKEQANGSW